MSENDIFSTINSNLQKTLNDPTRTERLHGGMTGTVEELPEIPMQKTTNDNNAQELTLNQIVSDIYLISPAQLELIVNKVSEDIARGLNLKMLRNSIKRTVDRSFRVALESAKRMGKKNS
jgi:hypothetical protein